MNAGTRYGEIGDYVEYIDAIDLTQIKSIRLYKKDINFLYRQSSLSNNLIICGAMLTNNFVDNSKILSMLL